MIDHHAWPADNRPFRLCAPNPRLVQLQEKGLGKTRTARFWTYVGDDAHPQTVYTFTLSSNRDGPQEFLKGYSGYLQADAYGGYDGLYVSGAIRDVACWLLRPGFFGEYDNRRSLPIL